MYCWLMIHPLFLRALLLVILYVTPLALTSNIYAQSGKSLYGGVSSFTLGKPRTIMTTSTSSTTSSYDSKYLGYFTILQLKPDLYYMYYECLGTNPHNRTHIAFAYSKDGFNWVKEYPSGVKHTVIGINGESIEESNLIFYDNIREFDVVKVQDPQYPYRLIANVFINPEKYINDTQLCMWKSSDGVNFIDMVVLLPSKHDTQPSIIVKGNLLKVYIRLRGEDDFRKRHIGYMYVDLEGNLIAPPTKLSDDLYYTSAASSLDEQREILFPTYWDQYKPQENHYEACIVENNRLFKLDVDMSVLSSGDDKWGMVCPHIITINHEQYIAYQQANFDHEGRTDSREKRVELRLSKITFMTEGQSCPPDPK